MQKDIEIGAYLYDQSVELLAHTGLPAVELNQVHEYAASFLESPEKTIEEILGRCQLVIKSPVNNTYPPLLPLTRRSHAFGRLKKRKAEVSGADIMHFTCMEAEPRLWRSIDKLRYSRRARKNKPAAVLFDIDDEPCGYQKHNGSETAYFWRNAIIPTENGQYAVPGDAFVDLGYKPEDDPRKLYPGVGLIAIRGALPTGRISFLRFSTANFPEDVRQGIFTSVADREPKLEIHETETVNFEPVDVCSAVMGLLKDNRAHTVNIASR